MSSRVSALEARRRASEAARMEQERAAILGEGPVGLDGLARLAIGARSLLPTQERFIFSRSRKALYRGPVGCAKSMSLIGAMLVPAMMMPGSRWGLFRATWWTLEQTTLLKFKEALYRLGPGVILDEKVGPPYQVWLNPAVQENGKPGAPVEVLCYGLDSYEKLGSQEFTGVFLEEANEISWNIASILYTRLRHKMPGQQRAVGPFFWRAALNPTDVNHWAHTKFCGGPNGCGHPDADPEPWGELFTPHPRENAANLPPNYYDEVGRGMTTNMKVRMIEGRCGPDPRGRPVFQDFSAGLHLADLQYNPRLPLWLSFDFGRRHPACLIAQITPEGHKNVLHVTVGDNVSLQEFASRMKQIVAGRFPQPARVITVCDPHGTQRKDTTEKTSVDVLREAGLPPLYRAISVESGLELISKDLNTLVRGRPVLQVARVGCAPLVTALEGGYCYAENKPGKKEPEKDGINDHPVDCLRYFEVCSSLGGVGQQHEWPTSVMKGSNNG